MSQPLKWAIEVEGDVVVLTDDEMGFISEWCREKWLDPNGEPYTPTYVGRDRIKLTVLP